MRLLLAPRCSSRFRWRLVVHSKWFACLVLSMIIIFRFHGVLNITEDEHTAFPMIIEGSNHKARQYTRRNKRGRTVMRRITNVSAHELTDLIDDSILQRRKDCQVKQKDENRRDEEKILDILKRAGVKQIDEATLNMLPTWNEVTSLYYSSDSTHTMEIHLPEPVVVGDCDAEKNRGMILGVAGFFNSGTNALTYYLRANLAMPELDDGYSNSTILRNGIMTQVPWDKHWFSSLRSNHTIPWMSAIDKSSVLPIVTIRDPFTWFQSMQRSPYMVELTKSDRPQLGPVRVPQMTLNRTWLTLFHLWNDWYRDYLSSSRPYVMIRVEDLWFQPERTLEKIRECTGARWINGENHQFTYVVDSSKWEHVRFEGPQSNLVTAMIKHANPRRRIRNLTNRDLQTTTQVLDEELMRMFHYNMPTISEP